MDSAVCVEERIGVKQGWGEVKGLVFLSAILCEGSLKVKGTMGQIVLVLESDLGDTSRL